jgi:hypothetical protein
MTSVIILLSNVMIVLQLLIMKSCAFNAGSDSSITKIVAKKKDRLYISFLITGKLIKLDLFSKISKIFIPNALLGHYVHVFMLLDNDKTGKSKGPFSNYNEKKLQFYIWNQTTTNGSNFGENFVSRVKYGSPSQDIFEIIASKFGEEHKNEAVKSKEGMMESLYWMNSLRDCVKWMQATEFEQRFHYDLVVRLRYLILFIIISLCVFLYSHIFSCGGQFS